MMSQNNKFIVRPSALAACKKLGGNSSTAILLYRMHVRSRKGGLRDEKGEKGWLALTKDEWLLETGLTRHEFDNSLKQLKANGLIKFRSRKLRRSDKNARSWYKLFDDTKSDIDDIMSGKPISGSSDLGSGLKSDGSETDNGMISEQPDALNNMLLKENEINKNVVTKTTGTTEPSALKNSKKVEGGYKKDIESVFKDSLYPPPVVSNNDIEAYLAIRDYLETNKNFLFCPEFHQGNVVCKAMRKLVDHWQDFKFLAETHNQAFNVPSSPRIWCMKLQLSYIPEFLNFLWYANYLGEEKLENVMFYNDFLKYLAIRKDDETLMPGIDLEEQQLQKNFGVKPWANKAIQK